MRAFLIHPFFCLPQEEWEAEFARYKQTPEYIKTNQVGRALCGADMCGVVLVGSTVGGSSCRTGAWGAQVYAGRCEAECKGRCEAETLCCRSW